MKSFRFSIACCIVILFAATGLGAQDWFLQGHGIGLYDGSRSDYDRTLRVVQAGDQWSLQDLANMGAFRTNGPKVFGAWLQGPPTDTFRNRSGLPAFLYKVRITNPGGESRTEGPYNFYPPGFATFFLADVQDGKEGTWRIDWILVNRDSRQERTVASDRFTMGRTAPSPGATGAHQAGMVHVGLYDGSRPDYAERVSIVQTGSRWSLKDLVETGAFRTNGSKVFGAWYRGPHIRTFTSPSGVIMLHYKVRVTNPKGKANEYGTYGFYTPGHAVYFLADVMNGMAGTWRVEWFTVHRDTKEEKRVQTDVFEMIP